MSKQRNWLEVIPPDLRDEFKQTFFSELKGKIPEVAIYFHPHPDLEHHERSAIYMRLSFLGKHTSSLSTGILSKRGKHEHTGLKRLSTFMEKVQSFPVEFKSEHGYFPSIDVIKGFALSLIRQVKDDRSLVGTVLAYAESDRVGASTSRNYNSLANKLREFDDITLDKISAEWIESFASHDDAALSTQKNRVSNILAALRFAGKEIEMHQESVLYMNRKQSNERDNKKLFLTKEELQYLKSLDYDSLYGEGMQQVMDVYFFACAMGDRKSELHCYKPGDHLLPKALIRLEKTDRGFEKEWMGDAREILEKYADKEPFKYLPPRSSKKIEVALPLSYRCWRDVKKVLSEHISSEIMHQGERKRKGDLMSFHSSKHTHIVHRLQDGESPYQIAKSLNMDVNTIDTYYSDYVKK